MARILLTLRNHLWWVPLAFGGLAAYGLLSNARDRGWTAADAGFWWVLVVLPVAGWLIWVGWSFNLSAKRRQAELDDLMIQAAAANGGPLTSADLARATPYTRGQAEAILSHYTRKGLLEPSLTDGGDLVYKLAIETPPPGRGKRRRRRPAEVFKPSGTYALSTLQIAQAQRILTGLLIGLLILLVAVSVLFTVAGSRIWPAP